MLVMQRMVWEGRRFLNITPSSSSMISFPMEARVVHLQLLVALTAQRLWALNLQTRKGGGNQAADD